MGLFQKQPITNTRTFYELDSEKTLLIVGLGNPGKEHDHTRHNAGFLAIDAFSAGQEFPGWSEKKALHSLISSSQMGKVKVVLAKPTTYMNQSGQAVRALQQYYKIPNPETLIISDELDLEFGKIRTRQGGSSGGHNGLESVINHCGEDFNRLRIGIGPKKPARMDSADFVLGKFSKLQSKNLVKMCREATVITSEYVYSNGKIHPQTRSFIL